MKAIIIKDLNGNPLYIARVEEVSDLDFLKLKKQCKENQENVAKLGQEAIAQLSKEIEESKKEIKILKGEE